jgi:hypothetical protein
MQTGHAKENDATLFGSLHDTVVNCRLEWFQTREGEILQMHTPRCGYTTGLIDEYRRALAVGIIVLLTFCFQPVLSITTSIPPSLSLYIKEETI